MFSIFFISFGFFYGEGKDEGEDKSRENGERCVWISIEMWSSPTFEMMKLIFYYARVSCDVNCAP
jgi:hypothetical protein